MVVVSSAVITLAPAAADPVAVTYRPPTDAPIVDRFRPPPRPWMSGNRGIDFATQPGGAVGAAADGRVIFSGPVGDTLHVTIEHADGLRTSYSFIAAPSVDVGDRVRAGDVVAIAAGPFHFGVRTPDGEYLDPEALLAGSLRPRARLVPGTDQGLEALGVQERRSLLDVLLDDGAVVLSATAAWNARTASLVAHYVVELDPSRHVFRLVAATARWFEDRRSCTPSSVSIPSERPRRIMVLVSGLGTSSDANTAWEIDTGALGYGAGDVVRYSYAGGQAPSPVPAGGAGLRQVAARPLDAIATRPFDSLDSQQSIGTSADRLTVLLQSVAAAEPGVPIDVVAHSQGGVVARLAIERAADEAQLPDSVATLVTLSSPQQGAPLATGVVALADSPGGAAALSQVRAAGLADDLDDRRPAISELGETSPIIDEMHQRPMPERVRFVTVGGSGDLVVPGSSAIDPTADAAIILPTPIGREAHGSLPSSAAATREIGLAVAGMEPGCRGLGEAVSAFTTAESIRFGETVSGASAALAAGVLAIPPGD